MMNQTLNQRVVLLNAEWADAGDDVTEELKLIREYRSVAESLLAALETAISIVKDTQEAWDSDKDSRVGKNLMALAGYNKKYRADCDTIHETISLAKKAMGMRL